MRWFDSHEFVWRWHFEQSISIFEALLAGWVPQIRDKVKLKIATGILRIHNLGGHRNGGYKKGQRWQASLFFTIKLLPLSCYLHFILDGSRKFETKSNSRSIPDLGVGIKYFAETRKHFWDTEDRSRLGNCAFEIKLSWNSGNPNHFGMHGKKNGPRVEMIWYMKQHCKFHDVWFSRISVY